MIIVTTTCVSLFEDCQRNCMARTYNTHHQNIFNELRQYSSHLMVKFESISMVLNYIRFIDHFDSPNMRLGLSKHWNEIELNEFRKKS